MAVKFRYTLHRLLHFHIMAFHLSQLGKFRCFSKTSQRTLHAKAIISLKQKTPWYCILKTKEPFYRSSKVCFLTLKLEKAVKFNLSKNTHKNLKRTRDTAERMF